MDVVNAVVNIANAVVKVSGRQHSVREGYVILANRIDSNVGDVIALDVVGGWDSAGLYKTGSVEAEVIEHKRGPKVLIFKKRRRKHSRSLQGHRQDLTALKVRKVVLQ